MPSKYMSTFVSITLILGAAEALGVVATLDCKA